MVSVALASMKGGTGKTTLAINLAERAAAAGLNPVLVDCDPQEQAVGLCSLRDEAGWEVVTSEVGRQGMERILSYGLSGEHGVVFCDLPGLEEFALGTILSRVDLVLAPVGPTAPEILGVANLGALAVPGRWPVWLVANNLPPGARRRQGLLDELVSYEMSICPAMLQRRVAHFDAIRLGLGVCEYSPQSVAAHEVDALWRWVAGRLGIETGPVAGRFLEEKEGCNGVS